MINTYQSSVAPPPVPPRHGRSHPVFIPAPLPLQGHSKTCSRVLTILVMLQLLMGVLTAAGFVYFHHNSSLVNLSSEAKALHSNEKGTTSQRVLAHMVVEKPTQREEKSTSNFLQWNIKHSVLRDVSYYHKVWVTIQQPGDYYVYSRVTFSKSSPHIPLVSKVKLRKSETEKEQIVMQAYCSLTERSDVNGEPIQHLCTATQGQVLTLESGNQLSVWVQNLTLVDYEDGATTFGMYKL